MTQLNSKSIQAILQEALSKDGDFLKEMVRMLLQEIMEATGRGIASSKGPYQKKGCEKRLQASFI